VPVEPLEQSMSAGYEERDVSARRLLYFLAAVGAILILSGLALHSLFEHFVRSTGESSVVARPFANDHPIPPEPRLQSAPESDRALYLASQQESLTTYGVVDREKGIVRIPIERAMQLVLQQGLPTRAAKDTAARTSAGATDMPLSRQSATKGPPR